MSVLVVPSRRLSGLGQVARLGALADDDSKLLIATSTDDLVIVGRCFSAFRQMVSQKMGGSIGALKVVFSAVDAVREALAAVGLAPDQSTMDAAQAKNDINKAAGEGSKYLDAIDGFLDGIANILVTRRPDWQVGYRKYSDGSMAVVVNRNGPDNLDHVDLDLGPTADFVECAKYIYDNRKVLEKIKVAGGGLRGLGAMGGLLVAVIIVVLGLVALIFLLTSKMALSKSVESSRLEEKLRQNTEQIALNTSEINRGANELTQLLAIPPTERTPSENTRIQVIQNNIDRLRAENRGLDAQNVQVQRGLEEVRKSQDLMDRLSSVIETGFKYVVYGGAAILLIGGVLWLWRPWK